MKKSQIEMILGKVSVNGEDAINFKVYKDGTTCRFGAGGLPRIGISGMSFFPPDSFFPELHALIPEELLAQPIMYQEQDLSAGTLEYVLAFYGESKNGETGEQADWNLSTGVRIVLSTQTQFNHDIMRFLDGYMQEVAHRTNSWYFDVMVYSAYDMKSDSLPEQSLVGQPKTREEITQDFGNYVNQIRQNPRGWDIRQFTEGKRYTHKDGGVFTAVIESDAETFRIHFRPVED